MIETSIPKKQRLQNASLHMESINEDTGSNIGKNRLSQSKRDDLYDTYKPLPVEHISKK